MKKYKVTLEVTMFPYTFIVEAESKEAAHKAVSKLDVLNIPEENFQLGSYHIAGLDELEDDDNLLN